MNKNQLESCVRMGHVLTSPRFVKHFLRISAMPLPFVDYRGILSVQHTIFNPKIILAKLKSVSVSNFCWNYCRNY